MTQALGLALDPSEVHVWWVRADALSDPDLLRTYEELLCPAERERHARYVFPHGRHEYLVTRALARTCLSRYASVPPAAWVFEPNRWGRPEITSPVLEPPLRFNLTNTRGLVACVVARDREVGLDVEDVTRPRATVGVADRFFARSEVEALHRLPEHDQPGRFFEYWTLKESYIKARGMGLALPLGAFAFHLDPPSPPRISFDARIEDDAASWQFEQLRPTERHLMAVAIRRRGEADLTVVTRECVPRIG